jgi:SSS family transporter
MGALDLVIVAVSLAAVFGISVHVARRQKTGDEYFLAGRTMTGGVLAMSILANQASAVSLVGAPAFVALREGGGLVWLQYELALPLAMLALCAFLLPALRSVGGASIYAYAERRFGRATRQALAGSFLLARGLSLGVIVYASALVVAEILGLSLPLAILVVGLFSVAYTSLGGIVADIWTDVVQLVLLWGGTFAAVALLLAEHGGALLRALPVERTQALVWDASGLGDGRTFALWPMLLGGFFLYLSYYGCDQSQAQRLLTARDDRSARRALVWNGLLRFPLAMTYCGLGLLLAALLRVDPSFAALMDGRPADSLVPVFITHWLPDGLRGLMLAAILAAAMSSIDSALNSLAAVTLEDALGLDVTAQSVWVGRATSLAWGAFAIAAALAFARSGTGVLELVNLVGSAFYGPVLAVFALGVLVPRATGLGALAGLGAGLGANLALAFGAPGVSWLWWNVAGFAVASATALAVDRAPVPMPRVAWPRESALLLGGFALMALVLVALG